ncbi:MAG: permease [Bacteroidales bacterium]|jgi:uncharacterized membrane protein YraQ (UPF0718 family)|nr:permease [Bacteroidales bacterium]
MQKKNNMFTTIIVMGIAALALTLFSYSKGTCSEGFKSAFRTGVNVLPAILFAFIIIGMINSLNPGNRIISLLGEDSGIKGICIAAIGGMLTPGSSLVAYPVAGSLLQSGAGIGPVVAYVIAWSTWQWLRTPFELSFMGWKFVLVNWCSIIILPVIGGLIAKALFSWVHF